MVRPLLFDTLLVYAGYGLGEVFWLGLMLQVNGFDLFILVLSLAQFFGFVSDGLVCAFRPLQVFEPRLCVFGFSFGL